MIKDLVRGIFLIFLCMCGILFLYFIYYVICTHYDSTIVPYFKELYNKYLLPIIEHFKKLHDDDDYYYYDRIINKFYKLISEYTYDVYIFHILWFLLLVFYLDYLIYNKIGKYIKEKYNKMGSFLKEKYNNYKNIKKK